MNWCEKISLLSPIISLVLIIFFFLIMFYPSEKRRLFQKNTKKMWQELGFWLSLLYEDAFSWLITGISVSVWFISILTGKIRTEVDSITLSVLGALAIPTFIGLIRRFANYAEVFEKVDNNTLWIVENLIAFIKNANISGDKKAVIIKHFYNKYSEDFGGLIIGADEKEYIQQLKGLLPFTRDSFFATLRGGKKPEYAISWFFDNSQQFGLTSKEKTNYLSTVNDASWISTKIRLMLFKEEELIKSFCNDGLRNEFLTLNANLIIFLADPTKVENYLINHEVNGITLTRREASFIWEDYAIFDNHIGVKHNGQNSLYFGMKEQISKMSLVFKLIKVQPSIFKRLNNMGIFTYDVDKDDWIIIESWDDWKQKLCNKVGTGNGSSTT